MMGVVITKEISMVKICNTCEVQAGYKFDYNNIIGMQWVLAEKSFSKVNKFHDNQPLPEW